MLKVKELVRKVLPQWENLKKISIYVDDGEGTYGLYSDDEYEKIISDYGEYKVQVWMVSGDGYFSIWVYGEVS